MNKQKPHRASRLHQLGLIPAIVLGLTSILATGCGGSAKVPIVSQPPAAPIVNVNVGLKQLIFSWQAVSGATHYKLFENEDGHSGFTQVGADIPAGTLSVTLNIAVHFHDFTNALYFAEACNAVGCNRSTDVNAMNGMLAAIGYFKASDTAEEDWFGSVVALSADGNTLAVAGGNTVHIFRFDGASWSFQVNVVPENSEFGDAYGSAIDLSADGNTLAVGAESENSSATGIGGDQNDNATESSGAVYVFRFDGTGWSEEAYIKASNTGENDFFGSAVALSADGDALAVGADYEGSNATGTNGDQFNDLAPYSGAVYVFGFDGIEWSQRSYIKASDTQRNDFFGWSVALNADGATLAVGALAGTVYVFRLNGIDWSQQDFIQGSNTEANDFFGTAIALSANGNTLVAGADWEGSNTAGVNGDQDNNLASQSGAAYVFRFDGTDWSQQAYIKASNTGAGDRFGAAISLSEGGTVLAVGAYPEDSNATGIDGDESDNSADGAGAAYVFHFDGQDWSQQAYVKASNTGLDRFGVTISLSADGETLAVGAPQESSDATGIGGDQNDNSLANAGAVYLY